MIRRYSMICSGEYRAERAGEGSFFDCAECRTSILETALVECGERFLCEECAAEEKQQNE